MSQRSITSFFGRASPAAGGTTKNTPSQDKTKKAKTAGQDKTKTKAEKCVKTPIKKEESEEEDIEDENNEKIVLSDVEDSPVKRCKRSRNKAVLSSSEDDEEKEKSPGSKENDSGNASTPRPKKKIRISLTPKAEKEDNEDEEPSSESLTKEDLNEEKEMSKRKRRKAEPKAKKSNNSKKKKASDADAEDNDGESKKGEVTLSPTKKSPKKESPKKKDTTPKKKSPATKKPTSAATSFFNLKKDKDDDDSKGGSKRNFVDAVRSSRFHPIDDADWKRGEKVPYLAFARTLGLVEETSGRLKTIEILANYFRAVMTLTPEDLLPSVYLCLNKLAPAYEGVELGVGEMILIKAIARTTGRNAMQIKSDAAKAGDLGIVAENSRGSQRTMFKPQPLTVRGVFAKLKSIAALTGHSSQDTKIAQIQSMLVASREVETRFVIRSLAGKLRIGLAEQSVLQALAHACVMTPPCQDYPPETLSAFKDSTSEAFKEKLEKEALALKTAYCECPNYDLVIPTLLESGIAGLPEKCKLTPGIPLKPMLAHPTKGIQEVLTRFENVRFTCEWKYDGERAQIHLHEDGTINVYSRNQENNTTKYPDVIGRFKSCRGEEVRSCVIDSEAVAWDRINKQILPFQVLSTRKRKDADQGSITVQVAIFAFDLLYLNGEALVRRPFRERRELLRKHFKEVPGEFVYAKCADPETLEGIQEALEESVTDKCEGLMVKTLDVEATYEIAKRSHNWLKLKKDYLDGMGDTLDLVVLGGYLGKGKRTGLYGGFLLGCYDPDNEEFQSICKIGTGFTDEALNRHYESLKMHSMSKPKTYYSYDASLAPDVWFDTVQVWEVKAADLSLSPVHKAAIGIVGSDRGISLRFPRFIRVRDDKNAEDCTSAQQVADMYNSQEMVKNTGKKPPPKSSEFDF